MHNWVEKERWTDREGKATTTTIKPKTKTNRRCLPVLSRTVLYGKAHRSIRRGKCDRSCHNEAIKFIDPFLSERKSRINKQHTRVSPGVQHPICRWKDSILINARCFLFGHTSFPGNQKRCAACDAIWGSMHSILNEGLTMVANDIRYSAILYASTIFNRQTNRIQIIIIKNAIHSFYE